MKSIENITIASLRSLGLKQQTRRRHAFLPADASKRVRALCGYRGFVDQMDNPSRDIDLCDCLPCARSIGMQTLAGTLKAVKS